MLKKNAFSWSLEAKEAFFKLKSAVSQAPVLALPDVEKPFLIECDASGLGVGAVLMQSNRPIAFLSKALKGRALHMSTYEKELFALVTAVQKWRPYLLGRPFVVKTDQQSLKYADALSRREGWENEAALFSISLPVADWVENLKLQYHHDLDLMKLIQQWNSNKLDHQKYSIRQGLLLYKNRIHIGGVLQLQQQVLQFVHCNPAAGHSGYERTMQRARRDFYWRGMKQSIKKFIRECLICQQNKQENTSPSGLLQPLPIPNRIWFDISLDFVEGLPISHGHSVILVVVDRLSKYAHFSVIHS